MADALKVKPDLNFIRELRASGGNDLKKCFQCATCSVACALTPKNNPFPRKEMLWAGWGLKDRLLNDPDVWLCYQCNDCSVECPRGVKPGDVMAAVRKQTFREFAFPKFMGKALANPKSLISLLLFPAIILFILLMAIHGWSFDFFHHHVVDYAEFFPHMYLEGLFFFGNIIVFLFAAISLLRFWKNLRHSSAQGKGPGFINALIATLIEVVLHRKFFDCTANKGRSWGHILIFAGFIGAMITAGLAVGLTVIIPVMESPLNLSNPVKILGVLSGAALLIGWLILYLRVKSNGDEVGKRTYDDNLFLNMLGIVALTGMLTYSFRGFGNTYVAYIIYFVHLVAVFFLLWYMPYSKFAHMLYRTLALTWVKTKNRGEAR